LTGPIRVNLGGERYVSPSGDEWQADRAYVNGEWGCLDMPSTDVLGTPDEIEDTEDDVLFQTIRVGEEIRYLFDLDPGDYIVRILFAEIYWESGDAEMQDVYINGRRVVRDFNIFDDAGHDRALEREFRTRVKENGLEVKFVGRSLPMHSGARACAIEVRRE
jgi:hypothetical protein